jgi:hypothetical protein
MVIAATPWDAMPNIRLCQKDPDIIDPISMDLGGRTLDAWILVDSPSSSAVCQFRINHPNGDYEDIRGVGFLPDEVGIWREMKVTVPLATPDIVQLGVHCTANDGWPGRLYIDDVSVR